LFSPAASQRTAYSEVPAQMAAHPRIGRPLYCRLGRMPDLNLGLPVYRLVSLPMSHHYPPENQVWWIFKNK
jgi:hypothetical protein